MKKKTHKILDKIDTIPTYVINIKGRNDRLIHIQKQFADKPKFDVSIVEATLHSIGAVGLWLSFKKIIESAQKSGHQFIIVCEDDLQFASDFNMIDLCRIINEGFNLNADVLIGGISWFNTMLKVSQDLFWVDEFTGAHFLVVHQKFFQKILDSEFGNADVLDLKISQITEQKFFIYPFIATQKEFGYSDVTKNHEVVGHVNGMFSNTNKLIYNLERIREHYHDRTELEIEDDNIDFENIRIPAYIVQTSSQPDRWEAIAREFSNKKEFEITVISPWPSESYLNENESRWRSHRKVVEIAIEADQDVIVICEENHEFTAQYSKEHLIKRILEAQQYEIDLLYGCSGDFGLAVPMTPYLFWINQVAQTQFVVLFRPFYEEILNYIPVEGQIYALTNMTNNKMLIYPSISSLSKEAYLELKNEFIEKMFSRTEERMKKLSGAYLRHK